MSCCSACFRYACWRLRTLAHPLDVCLGFICRQAQSVWKGASVHVPDDLEMFHLERNVASSF